MTKFDIKLLIDNGEYLFTAYISSIIPVIGDKIKLFNGLNFYVEERFLPSDESNEIILFGKLI